MERRNNTSTATVDATEDHSSMGWQAAYPSHSDGGAFQPASLQNYGICGATTLLSAIDKRKASNASFSLFDLGENGADEVHLNSCSPLAALTSALENVEHASEQMLDLLNCSSSWGPSVCCRVTVPSWDTPGAAECIQRELRLATFLCLRAVVVPLPECGDDGKDETAAFAASVAVLGAHLRQTQITHIWVDCDATCQSHRVAYSRLRTVLLWGGAPPAAVGAPSSVSREVVHRVAPYLHFSQTFGALPSEWLGEPIIAFEVPSVDKLLRALRPGAKGFQSVQLPSDVMPFVASYWAAAQPPFLSLGAFVVELLRRRAAPVFPANYFLESYALVNQLCERCVVDNGKDFFAAFEDVLELPLQPLGHMLPSGAYEVFEQDRKKYQQYYVAMRSYFREWLTHREEWSHWRMWCRCHDGAESGATEDAVYVVLLGAGRGPLIGECLAAATDVGVRVHLFAVEKNPEAVEFVRLRLRADQQWRQWMHCCGHVVETIHADGRSVTMSNGPLPPRWGLCDLVVSELLGSFGDNELSPECIDGFYADLQCHQTSAGLPSNPHVVSIPMHYTAWIAPLHSGWMEEAVADAAVSGLSVLPPWCRDGRASLFHSMFVSNLCRAVALSPPQACWTFHHFSEGEQRKERDVTLNFSVDSSGRCCGFVGYFSALLYELNDATRGGDNAGVGKAPIALSTLPDGRTEGMFSWFPCVFAVEPRDVMEVRAGSTLQLRLRRCVNKGDLRVWYSYDAAVLQGAEEGVKTETAAINEGGWAASVLLSS
ncbi:putative arginine N-methyltransferase, type II [Trypanosoma grayi]|uniref:putative arginine N-methyltransferase, type II n=1 Tax=Trypanosoma grayi TaxID=71804 RepID=UPI0004F48D6A|nr:putative arginine N-methyltransferase, type II [Trypanosoma grayi]KEG13216.1 putative arginine N-methyltransferase, type II [Trypanosoma grayi]